jgi:leucyl aminopeptidase (aminopeptidase T)
MTATPKNENDMTQEGARQLLSTCLGLKEGDVLSLFCDETVKDMVEVLRAAASSLGLRLEKRWVSMDEQARFRKGVALSIDDEKALSSGRAILTCLSDHPAGTAYRQALLRLGTTMGKMFGHMPGATKSLLAYAATIDYEQAASRCDDLALALTLGEQARLRTFAVKEDGERAPYDLTFGLGGFRRYPITSNGIIALGTWGNIPGGETFIAPMEDTADGTFVLNGAYKGVVLPPGEHLLLHFKKGYLLDEAVRGTERALVAFRPFLSELKERGGVNFGSLAELGIGVNTSIRELTGKALFDEKCAGTAHIAIGDNTRYGGSCESDIHEDLITRSPTLWVDDKLILKDGADAFNPAEWREGLSDCKRKTRGAKIPGTITRTTTHAERTASGHLQVKEYVVSGRLCIYTVGDDETSQILARVFSGLSITMGQTVKFDQAAHALAESDNLDPDTIRAALAIMERHKLVKLS